MDNPYAGIDDPTGRSLYDANRDIVMGHEFVGEVISHGPGCSLRLPDRRRSSMYLIGGRWRRRLANDPTNNPEAQGSFGERTVVPEAAARVVEGDVSSDAIAVVDCFAVGELHARAANVQPGEVPIVIGAGAVGGFCCRCIVQSWHPADHRVRLPS